MEESQKQVLETFRSPYNTVVVRRCNRRINFDAEGATFATWHPERLLTGYSWDAITAAALLHPGPLSSLLLLGLAGGTAVRQLRALQPHLRITSVEIDAALVVLGRKYMALDESDTRIVIDDAYDYLARTRQRFDVIADDVYRTGPDDVERPDRPIDALIERMARQVRPGGTVLANFVRGDHHENLYRQARAVFRETFPAVAQVRPPRGYNTILVGGSALRLSREVRKFAARLHHPEDRRLWRCLSIRRI